LGKISHCFFLECSVDAMLDQKLEQAKGSTIQTVKPKKLYCKI
jgi:hypothetical protein